MKVVEQFTVYYCLPIHLSYTSVYVEYAIAITKYYYQLFSLKRYRPLK